MSELPMRWLRGQKLAELIGERDYDIYVLDVNLPDISGFDLVDMIREINESARIIISTMHEEIWIINRLIRQKVNAVILKSSEAVEFENAVKSVLEGNPYTCPRFQSIRQKLSLSPVQIHSKDTLQSESSMYWKLSRGDVIRTKWLPN